MWTEYSSFIGLLREHQYNARACECRPANGSTCRNGQNFACSGMLRMTMGRSLARTEQQPTSPAAPRHHEFANHRQGCGASVPGDRTALVFPALRKQAELRRVARGFGEAEVAKGVRGQEPPARRALDE